MLMYVWYVAQYNKYYVRRRTFSVICVLALLLSITYI